MDVGKLQNHLKICVLYLFALDQFLLCFIIQTISNGLRFIMARFYLRFYNCYILCSSNWRRLWGLHFKLRRYDVLVHQKAQRFNQEQQMIFLLITACPTKRKGKDSGILFRKTRRIHISGMSNNHSISWIFSLQ